MAKLIRCEHSKPAQFCETCITANIAPHGYRFDWSRCSTCQRTRELHDICEAKVAPEMRHRPTPYLRQLKPDEAAAQDNPTLI